MAETTINGQITDRQRMNLNALALQSDLRDAVRGEVRFDAGTRAIYAHDSSNYRQTPFGVVIPRDEDDAVAAIEVCKRHGAPVMPRGCGTGGSRCGSPSPEPRAGNIWSAACRTERLAERQPGAGAMQPPSRSRG